jgi:hypothetical protein
MLSYNRKTQELVHPTLGSFSKLNLIAEIESAIDNEVFDRRLLGPFTEVCDLIGMHEKYPKRKTRGRVLFRNTTKLTLHYMVYETEYNTWGSYFHRIRQSGYNNTAYVSFLLLMSIIHPEEVIFGISGSNLYNFCFNTYIRYDIDNMSIPEIQERIRRVGCIGNYLYDESTLFRSIHEDMTKHISQRYPTGFRVELCPKPYVYFSQLQFRRGNTGYPYNNLSIDSRLMEKLCSCSRNENMECKVCLSCRIYDYTYSIFLQDVSLFDLILIRHKDLFDHT